MATASCCRATGDGLRVGFVEVQAAFTISAHDELGQRLATGGLTFAIVIRSTGQRIRAKVVDRKDGTYYVSFRPTATGRCSISVSLAGEPIQGSPYACEVTMRAADAAHCEVVLPPQPAEQPVWTIVAHDAESFGARPSDRKMRHCVYYSSPQHPTASMQPCHHRPYRRERVVG